MKKVLIGVSSVVAVVAAIGLALFGMYVSLHDTAVTAENNLVKYNQDRENVLSSVTLTIQQTAGVSAKYSKDLKELVKATFEGRYGDNGSQATMQFMQERNINFDTKLALKTADVIEGGNKEFQIYQSRFLEVCESYKNMLDSYVRGGFLKRMDFPRINMAETCIVVSDKDTKDTMKTGVRKEIKFE